MRARIAQIIIATAMALGAGSALVANTADCEVMRAGDGTTQAAWDAAMDAGWQGNPTDSMEALYSPNCFN